MSVCVCVYARGAAALCSRSEVRAIMGICRQKARRGAMKCTGVQTLAVYALSRLAAVLRKYFRSPEACE